MGILERIAEIEAEVTGSCSVFIFFEKIIAFVYVYSLSTRGGCMRMARRGLAIHSTVQHCGSRARFAYAGLINYVCMMIMCWYGLKSGRRPARAGRKPKIRPCPTFAGRTPNRPKLRPWLYSLHRSTLR